MGIIQQRIGFIDTFPDNTADASLITAQSVTGARTPLDTRQLSDAFMTLIEPTDLSATASVQGDFLSDFTIPGAFTRVNGTGILQQCTLINIGDANTYDVMLWLFESEPTQSLTTGDPFSLADAEMEKLLYKIIIRGGSFEGATLNSAGQVGQQGVLVRNNDSTTNLYAIATALTSFTPVNSAFKWRFGILPL